MAFLISCGVRLSGKKGTISCFDAKEGMFGTLTRSTKGKNDSIITIESSSKIDIYQKNNSNTCF